VPDDVIVEWCDREAELLRALAATRPCSLPGLLQKVAAALDRLFVESGDGKLSTFTPADQELFKAVAEDVTVALALIAPA